MDRPGRAMKESQDPGCRVLYSQQIKEKEVGIKLTYQWLKRPGLKDNEDSIIMAAQEQALSTRPIKAGVYNNGQDIR